MNLLIFLLILLLVFWAFERFYLRGGGVADYPAPDDADTLRVFASGQASGPQQRAVINTVEELISQISVAVHKHQLGTARAVFDSISDGRDYVSEFLAADAGGVPAEWVIAPGADPGRRVLYIHGGGFIMGCPKSHRTMTSKFSEITGCSVLAIDYRLMPENRHRDCVEDCRTAYRWILENGPGGPSETQQLF